MKKAWIVNDIVRDICPANPVDSYHSDIAKLYDTDVPDTAVNGATLVAGVWTNPPPPVPPTAAEIAAQAVIADKARLLIEVPQFLIQADTESDALVRSVIGERTSEYELAEREAIAYKAAGYPATGVPSSVSSWAIATGYTNTVSADNIITAATGWRTAQASMRAKRLLVKEQASKAVDIVALDAVKADWAVFMVSLKTTLGVA